MPWKSGLKPTKWIKGRHESCLAAGMQLRAGMCVMPKPDIHNLVVAVRDYRLGCAPTGTHWPAGNTACSDERRCLPLAKTLPRT